MKTGSHCSTAMGESLKNSEDTHQFLNDDEIKANNDIFQSLIASTPDGERFVTVCSKTDLFEFYDVEAGLQRRFQGPLGLKLFVETSQWEWLYAQACTALPDIQAVDRRRKMNSGQALSVTGWERGKGTYVLQINALRRFLLRLGRQSL